MNFVRVSAIAKVLPLGGVVARSDRFEIWARRYRVGHHGDRRYVIGFDVVEILSTEPRSVRDVTDTLPANCRSNLKKIVAHLEARS